MRATDVELEIRDHLTCSHNWTYTHWQRPFSGTVDHGFSMDSASDRPSKEASRRSAPIPSSEMHGQETMRKISEVATKAVFWWCCNQVKKGFGEMIVPRRSGRDVSLKEKEESKPKDPRFIHAWLEKITT
jgi:hypothetical protein